MSDKLQLVVQTVAVFRISLEAPMVRRDKLKACRTLSRKDLEWDVAVFFWWV
jgi:hypothetical protein